MTPSRRRLLKLAIREWERKRDPVATATLKRMAAREKRHVTGSVYLDGIKIGTVWNVSYG